MRNLKKVIALIAVSAMMVSTVAFAATFDDVDSSNSYSEAIDTLSNLSILTGDDENNDGVMSFRPEDTITRAEIAVIVARLQGYTGTVAQTDTIFSDVTSSHWASGYIAMAANQEIVNGNGDGTFGVNDNITREDMAVIIDRAVKLVGYDVQTGEPSFNDNDQISDYAYESVGCMQANGIIQGYEGNFSPKDTATRAEAAKVVAMVMALK